MFSVRRLKIYPLLPILRTDMTTFILHHLQVMCPYVLMKSTVPYISYFTYKCVIALIITLLKSIRGLIIGLISVTWTDTDISPSLPASMRQDILLPKRKVQPLRPRWITLPPLTAKGNFIGCIFWLVSVVYHQQRLNIQGLIYQWETETNFGTVNIFCLKSDKIIMVSLDFTFTCLHVTWRD